MQIHIQTYIYAIRFLLLIVCKRLTELYSRSDTIFSVDIYPLLSCNVSLPLSASPESIIFNPRYLSSVHVYWEQINIDVARIPATLTKTTSLKHRKCRI